MTAPLQFAGAPRDNLPVPVSIEKILNQTPLFKGLPSKVLLSVAKQAREMRLERDEILFLGGEPAKGLYVIAEGSIRAFRTGIDGREQVIHVERAVTTIAEVPVFDGGKYPSTAAAETLCTIYMIPRDVILNECRLHPELALAAARLLAGRLRMCAELVESLSLREVGQRLAKLFLDRVAAINPDAKDTVEFEQPLTHNQLAARIGTVREVVSRALQRLQAQGLVDIDGKRIVVGSVRNLKAYAGVE